MPETHLGIWTNMTVSLCTVLSLFPYVSKGIQGQQAFSESCPGGMPGDFYALPLPDVLIIPEGIHVS